MKPFGDRMERVPLTSSLMRQVPPRGHDTPSPVRRSHFPERDPGPLLYSNGDVIKDSLRSLDEPAKVLRFFVGFPRVEISGNRHVGRSIRIALARA